jgi:putative intracellular protease/amidase
MALNVGVLVYGGYQELEFWYPLLRLREADVAVSVLGVLNEASASGAVIAGISQAGALVPQGKSGKSIVAKSADELPQWTKALLNELSVRT